MAQEILVSINVSSGKAQAGLESTRKSVSKLESAQEKLNYELSEEAKELAKVNALIAANRAANNRAAFASKEYGEAIQKAQKNTKNYKTQAGLNNAILLETGRLASDASYGFTAIANNLSQLVSLGGSFIDTTGSVSSALGELKKSLFGIGGLLLGFQVLIGLFQDKRVQDFAKSLFGLNGNLKTLSDLTKDASKNAESLVGNFKIYTKIIRDTSESEEQRAIALEKLNKEYPDFNANILDEITNTRNATAEIDRYVASLRKRALSQAAENKFREISGKIVEIELQKEIDKTIERDEFLEKSNRAIIKQELSSGQTIMVSQEEKAKAYVDAVQKIDKAADDEISKEQEKLDFLIKLIDVQSKTESESAEFQIKIFKAKYANFEKIEEQYRRKSQKDQLLTEQEILAQTQQNEMAKIDIMEEAFVRRQQIRLKEYKAQLDQDVRDGKISREEANRLALEADAKYADSLKDLARQRKSLEVQVFEFIDSLRQLQIRRNSERAQADFDKMIEIRRALSMDEANALKFSVGNNAAYYDEKGRLISQDIERQKKAIAFFKEGTLERAKAERELFNLQQSLRENDKQKELAYIDDKKSINLEYVGFTKGISQIFSTIAGENEGLQKAALILEKGAAIADIVIKTQAANAATVAQDTATLGATIPITTPLRLRNNITAGISIANILATTLTSFKKPSTNGGGGATATASVQAPAFNVVGASSTDQLAQAVSGQVQQPVRAFVVGAEITDQQALDRKIIETAGL